jgi:hypothetical protein
MVYNLYELSSLDEEGIKGLISGIKAIELNEGMAYMCEVPKEFASKLTKIKNVINEKGAIELFNI